MKKQFVVFEIEEKTLYNSDASDYSNITTFKEWARYNTIEEAEAEIATYCLGNYPKVEFTIQPIYTKA